MPVYTEERILRRHRRRPPDARPAAGLRAPGRRRLSRRGGQPEPQRRRRVGRPGRRPRPHHVSPRLGRRRSRYAEFRHLGKEGVLGKYSLHFHRLGDTMRGSSVVGASIWDSGNRWITIHGTNYLVVRDCVGYQCVGHGFFLEDGTEVNNVLDRNLAVQAYVGKKLPDQVLPFDQNDGAGFWWANSRNSFTRNVTCENDRYGYRFEATPNRRPGLTFPVLQPDGSRRAVDIRTLPFVRFEGNESHCDGKYGLNLGEGVDRVGPDHRHPFVIKDMKIWKAHYAFRPESPSVLVDGMTIYRGRLRRLQPELRPPRLPRPGHHRDGHRAVQSRPGRPERPVRPPDGRRPDLRRHLGLCQQRADDPAQRQQPDRLGRLVLPQRPGRQPQGQGPAAAGERRRRDAGRRRAPRGACRSTCSTISGPGATRRWSAPGPATCSADGAAIAPIRPLTGDLSRVAEVSDVDVPHPAGAGGRPAPGDDHHPRAPGGRRVAARPRDDRQPVRDQGRAGQRPAGHPAGRRLSDWEVVLKGEDPLGASSWPSPRMPRASSRRRRTNWPSTAAPPSPPVRSTATDPGRRLPMGRSRRGQTAGSSIAPARARDPSTTFRGFPQSMNRRSLMRAGLGSRGLSRWEAGHGPTTTSARCSTARTSPAGCRSTSPPRRSPCTRRHDRLHRQAHGRHADRAAVRELHPRAGMAAPEAGGQRRALRLERRRCPPPARPSRGHRGADPRRPGGRRTTRATATSSRSRGRR